MFEVNDWVWFVAGGSGNAIVSAVNDKGYIQVRWDNDLHNPDDTWWPPEDFDFCSGKHSKDANPFR